MKVHGIELQVGEKPPELYKSHILAFNDAFLRMFESFQENPEDRVILVFHGSHKEEGKMTKFGYLLVSKVWKVLAYNQRTTS